MSKAGGRLEELDISNDQVKSAIDKLSTLKTKEFIVDNPDIDLVQFGLWSPNKFVITLKDGSGMELDLGDSYDETSDYAKRSDANEVFAILKDDVSLITKDIKNLTKK
jgi:hypothetical protein